jgi:hypothetical protein
MHKFKVGQRVLLSGSKIERGVAGFYRVIKQLPEEQGDHQYRLQSTTSTQERVAKESQLSAVETLS